MKIHKNPIRPNHIQWNPLLSFRTHLNPFHPIPIQLEPFSSFLTRFNPVHPTVTLLEPVSTRSNPVQPDPTRSNPRKVARKKKTRSKPAAGGVGRRPAASLLAAPTLPSGVASRSASTLASTERRPRRRASHQSGRLRPNISPQNTRAATTQFHSFRLASGRLGVPTDRVLALFASLFSCACFFLSLLKETQYNPVKNW